jgi:Tat protein secretion system quality control protein TatD with DNase activity
MLKYFKKVSKAHAVLPNVVMHSYGGSKEITQSLLKINNLPIYFSLSLKRSEELCKTIPIERLLLETDSPYQLDKQVVAESGIFPNCKF